MTAAARKAANDARNAAYVQDLIARAPRLTDEQARGLVVIFQRGRARREARLAAERAS